MSKDGAESNAASDLPGSDTIIKGLVWLPSRDVTLNGDLNVNSDSLTIVLNSLILNGNATWKVAPLETWCIQAPGSGGTPEQV